MQLPEVESPPSLEQLILDPEEVQALVSAQLPASALFAARFRENAARSLLLPKRRPGQRTPLWQQRMRSAGLLQVAGQYPDFPILAETWREVMSDHFDMPALASLLRSIRSREIRVVAVDTERASPFASSILFSYVAEFMYEGDAPLAERRAQALTLDRDLLSELLGSEDLRELLDPAAIAEVELELQGLLPERFPRDADEAHDLLARLGDLSDSEAVAGPALSALVARGEVIAGEFRRSVRGREHCHPEVLRMLRRRSLAALRREVESVSPDVMARFLPEWHGIGSRAPGMDRLLEVVFQLQGLALPASVIERDVIAGRVHSYNPRLMAELVSLGEVVWAGRGSIGTDDG